MTNTIVSEIMKTCTEQNLFFKGNAEIMCTCLVQYIAFEYNKSVEELTVETTINELKSIDELITEQELPIKIFLLVAQAYSERMKIIGNDKEVLDFSFLLDQSDKVVQSSYLTFSKVLENTMPTKEFVSIATLGFMNDQVKDLANRYKLKIKEEREEA